MLDKTWQTSASSTAVERLWRNHKRYCGEVIDADEVLQSCMTAALASGWRLEPIGSAVNGGIPAFVRQHNSTGAESEYTPRLYISAGIHGDEPAGPLAAEKLLTENRWPSELEIWLCPCLNPEAFELNTREDAAGVDLNRQYLNPRAERTAAHIRWLERQPRFDLSLCLHEDWESCGFYVYELNPQGRPSLAERIVAAAATACPVDNSPTIEGWPATNGVIRPQPDINARKDWPEAFYLIRHKSPVSYTLEAPSDFPLTVRVRALVEGVNAACVALAAK